jgi:hypothetical protein
MNADFCGATHTTSCSVDLTAAYPELPEGRRRFSLAARSETECFAHTKWFLERLRSRAHIRQARGWQESVIVCDFGKDIRIYGGILLFQGRPGPSVCVRVYPAAYHPLPPLLLEGVTRWYPQACSLFHPGQSTRVAPIAAVERGPSEGARSGSTGATWVLCCSASFLCPLIWEGRLGVSHRARGQQGESSLYLSLGEWPRLPSTARIGRYTCSLQACLVPL